MAPEAVVHATKSWLQSSWHVQVPFAWLEACVDWLQEEAGGAGPLSQRQINQQALDQWLLTDLRDLGFPVLPEGLAQAQKTELRGIFCVQVDSLLDISQPAYGQLQKWRGADCTNDEVSATTQATQKPWEAKSTRMLLLQVTDGVQSLEAMEYQPIPALSTDLRPGVKLQLQGQIVCRLGVLLLGPSNIKVLGGEVEDLTDRNHQGKVLCRTLGLPEDQQQAGEEATPLRQGNQEVEDLEIDDQELLASLEVQEQVERVPVLPVRDSGYVTFSETSTQSSRNSSVRSLISNASARSEISAHPSRSGSTQSSRGHHHGNQQQESGLLDTFSSDHMIEQVIADHHMADEDFPEEDFDDLPLDELDNVLQESNNAPVESDSGNRHTLQNSHRTGGHPDSLHRTSKLHCGQVEQHRDGNGSMGQLVAAPLQPRLPSAPPGRSDQSSHSLSYDERDFMDEDMDCFFEEVELHGTGKTGQTHQPTVQTSKEKDNKEGTCSPSATDFDRISAKTERQSDITPPALTLTTPPFIYLSLLEKIMPKPQLRTLEIRVKAFIVTLIGKLSSSNGSWRVCATISDGSGYLDVELSDAVLTGLLGFSVAEKAVLKRDPSRRRELDAGMKRCQEELVDMCCVMTIAIEPEGRKTVVTKADPVSEIIHKELEQRVRDRRK